MSPFCLNEVNDFLGRLIAIGDSSVRVERMQSGRKRSVTWVNIIPLQSSASLVLGARAVIAALLVVPSLASSEPAVLEAIDQQAGEAPVTDELATSASYGIPEGTRLVFYYTGIIKSETQSEWVQYCGTLYQLEAYFSGEMNYIFSSCMATQYGSVTVRQNWVYNYFGE